MTRMATFVYRTISLVDAKHLITEFITEYGLGLVGFPHHDLLHALTGHGVTMEEELELQELENFWNATLLGLDTKGGTHRLVEVLENTYLVNAYGFGETLPLIQVNPGWINMQLEAYASLI